MTIKDDRPDGESGLLLELTSEIVAAYLSNNAVPSAELPNLIESVHKTLSALSEAQTSCANAPTPAVPISKSVTPDYIVCLEDGREMTMLRRYIRSKYGMTPEEYRAKWNLPPDYPMVAPNYAKKRSQYAKESGLGKKTSSKPRPKPKK